MWWQERLLAECRRGDGGKRMFGGWKGRWIEQEGREIAEGDFEVVIDETKSVGVRRRTEAGVCFLKKAETGKAEN